MYGSSRLGIYQYHGLLPAAPVVTNGTVTTLSDSLLMGNTSYELSNHLGNVLAVVNDKKIGVSSVTDSSLTDHYVADVLSLQDYYAFGSQMLGRSYQANKYRYGFNGKENDNEVKGDGNQQDYGMRIYDPRLSRFLTVDPLTPKYPELTPYQFASNRPIDGIDRDGLEYCPYIPKFNTDGRSFSSYVAAFDNGVIDILNIVPAMWNGAVSTVQSLRKGTYGQDLREETKQVWNGLKQTGTKIWNEPLQTLTSPDALEFLVASYAGAKMLPGGGKGNLIKPMVSNEGSFAKQLEFLRNPAITPGFWESTLINYGEGLASRQFSRFTNPVKGTVGDPNSKYLWTIDKRGINIALEQTPASTSRGFITHTNISSTASAGGEVWFTGEKSVFINAKSARFGGASITADQWNAVREAWKKIGYKVESAEFKPPIKK